MTPAEAAHVRDVLTFFYPSTVVQRVTDKLGDLGAEMLYEAVKGSKLMDLVPRPAGIKPGLGWLVSQAVQLFWRNVGKQRIYVSVRDVVAGRYRAAFIVACAEAA